MAGYLITYKIIMKIQNDIAGSIKLPPSYKLTEEEIIATIIRKEPNLRHAKSLSVTASEVLKNDIEDYVNRTYSQEQISRLLKEV